MANPAIDREAMEQAVQRGSELLKQGKLDDAIKAFSAALVLDGENARVLALLGLTYFRAGQFAQARPIYEDLVERSPTDASFRLNLGLVHLKLGEPERAIAALEASRALDPSQGRAVSYLGLAYARAGRYAEAYRAFILAGQHDLASEIEVNLTPAEKQSIHTQLARTGIDHRTEEPASEPPAEPAKSDAVANLFAPSAAPAAAAAPVPAAATAAVPDPAPVPAAAAAPDTAAPSGPQRLTDSLQFVLPKEDAIPTPSPNQSILSRAVEIASPSSASAAAALHTRSGGTPPIPLSQLATDDLVRPDDGDDPFEVTAGGALVIRITDRVLTRLDGVHVTGGDLAFEPAMRRSRGHQTEERFDHGGAPLHTVSGTGYLVAVPGDRVFTAVALDDDIFYLREDLVFAFEASLRWENGNIPGLRGRLPVVQFRGDGAVAMRSTRPLVRVKLTAQGVVFVDASRLAGWIGRVIPRAVVPPSGGPMGDVCVECTGEGIVLIDPVGEPQPAARDTTVATPTTPPPTGEPAAPARERAARPSPPPPPGAEVIREGETSLAELLLDDEI